MLIDKGVDKGITDNENKRASDLGKHHQFWVQRIGICFNSYIFKAVDPEFIKMLAVEDEDDKEDEAYDSNEDNSQNDEKTKAEKKKAEQERHEENFKKYGKELRSELMKSKRWGKRDKYPRFSDIPSSMARESRRIFQVI